MKYCCRPWQWVHLRSLWWWEWISFYPSLYPRRWVLVLFISTRGTLICLWFAINTASLTLQGYFLWVLGQLCH